MFIREFKKRVRYSQTDQMGYLYYGNYAELYEIGRAEAIRSIGITYKELEETLGIMMPVLQVQSRFLYPVKYDELITIRTILKELPTKMIHFFHEVDNEQGQLVHKGEVKLFFVHMHSNKRVSAPDYLLDKISPFFV